MNYIDYRKALGIGFDDSKKAEMLKSKILVFFDSLQHDQYIIRRDFEQYLYYYYLSVSEKEDKGCYRWNNLAKNITKEGTIASMVCRFVMLLHHLDDIFGPDVPFVPYGDNESMHYKNSISSFIVDALDDLKIAYTKTENEDGLFIFPTGAKELDEALVTEPLEWLNEYPRSRETFIRALKQYANGEYVRDVADNFRKALEGFFQEFLGNDKNLANNKIEICKFLGSKNAEPEIGSMMQALLNSYNNLNNSATKHNDKLDPKYLEFLMYQTGLFVRMVITAGQDI